MGAANAGTAFGRSKENIIDEVEIRRMSGFMREAGEFVKVILDFLGGILLRLLQGRYFFPEVFWLAVFRFPGILSAFACFNFDSSRICPRNGSWRNSGQKHKKETADGGNRQRFWKGIPMELVILALILILLLLESIKK